MLKKLLREFFAKVRFSPGHGGILARGAVNVFIIKVAGAGLVFVLHVILARFLGAGQYGIYVYAWTWIRILSVLCLLGFQTSLVRFIAEYKFKRQWGMLRGILHRSRQFVLSSGFLVVLAGFLFIWATGGSTADDSRAAFYIAFLALPVLLMLRLQEASLRALKRAVCSSMLYEIIRPVLTGAGIIVLFYCPWKSPDAGQAMAVNLTAVILTALTGAFFLRGFLPAETREASPEYADKKWLKVSLPLLFVAVMGIILNKTDIVMLGILKGAEPAGIYAAAANVANLVNFSLFSINFTLGPMIAELYHANRKKELQRIIALAARAIFALTLVTGLALVVFGKFVLGLFGVIFVGAYIPLLILLSGQIASSLTGSVGSIMTMSGRQNALGMLVGASAVVNVLLNAVLIHVMGLTGAAVATAVSMAICNAAMLIYVRINLGLNPTVLARINHERA